MNLPDGFPHKAPAGYSYEVRDFKRNVVSIWLQHHASFSYTSDPVYTIWGFYDTKKVLHCTHQSQAPRQSS